MSHQSESFVSCVSVSVADHGSSLCVTGACILTKYNILLDCTAAPSQGNRGPLNICNQIKCYGGRDSDPVSNEASNTHPSYEAAMRHTTLLEESSLIL